VITEPPKISLPVLDKEEESKTSDPEDVEELQSSKIKLSDNAIYCIGDTRFILMFDQKNSLW